MALQFGRYVVEDEVRDRLGKGAFGQVYRAFDPKLNRPVAIKVLLDDVRADTADAERFFREARALATLQHPGIVPVFDFGDENGVFYLVLAFFPGGTLQGRLLERLKAGVGAFTPAETLALLEPICGGLAAAHRHGMIHRDLKPANLLLDEEGRPAISDFGLVHLLNEAGATALTQRGDVMGTPAYMAPEQWEPEVRAVTAQTDLYALGCVVHCLLTGQAPFQGSAPVLQARHLSAPPPRLSAVLPGLPQAWDDAVGCLLAKDPEERFPTADAFLDWLKLALGDATQRLPARTAPVALPTASAPGVSTPHGSETTLAQAATLRAPPSAASADAPASPLSTQLGEAATLRAAATAPAATTTAPPPAVPPARSRGLPLAVAGAVALALGLLGWLLWPRLAGSPGSVAAATSRPTHPSAPVVPGGPNSLGLRFVRVPLPDGSAVEVAVLETRRQDFEAYAEARRTGAWSDPTPLPPAATPNWREPGFAQDGRHPVVYVSWDDASAFCRWLTARERADGTLAAALEYRLPREAEWAAAAGPSPFPWHWEEPAPGRRGDEWPPPDDSGNFNNQPEWKWDDGFRWTAPSGTYKRNFFGLHDLAGNVHEWCADLYASGSPERSLRGGSYTVSEAAGLLSRHRRGELPGYRDGATGFRIVRAAVR